MTNIANRYRILSELGKGGMGTVYKAEDSLTQSIVAVKHLKTELTAPELIERFKREGEALRELNHPNIVKLLDTVEHDGAYYLIMEYVAGGDLHDLLKAGQLPIERCLRLALDLADALTRAHKLDIIHRDLKPANVLLADDGTLRLSDFGVARMGQRERVTATDMIVGTVDYLAPEALDGAGIDARADIWAFGVMLFEMVGGKRPFTGESLTATLTAILTHPVPDLETLRPDAPVALIDLIYRLLEKERDARIRTVRYVGAELEDILSGQSDRTPPAARFAPSTPDFLQRPKHNLPAQTTPFVGREAELLELTKLLDNPKIRLITIVAQGGMGKTRLALEVAGQQLINFENGVYFVELVPLTDSANIVSAIAEAVSYQFQADGRDQKQQILDFLANKNLLLVLDNYEHLLEGASLVTDILKAAPQMKILATSRQRLNQSGETLFNLEGMDFPAWETPEDALEYAAVKLFIQSAKRAKPDFELVQDNMDAIARICKLVQGLPLGIVLAASWLSMLSVDEIATEIAKGIDFLESDMSDIPERQRSIRAVFDYSWDLMTAAEKQVFMKLSVFRGGFTREAAEAVAAANLRILMNLMNKSLIRRDANSGRYDIHELLRQYGETKLDESGEKIATEDAHARYFVNFMATRLYDLKGSRAVEATHEITNEWENIGKSTLSLWVWKTENFNIVRYSTEAIYLFTQIQNRWGEVTHILEQVKAHIPAEVITDANPVWQMATLRFLLSEGLLTDDKSAALAQVEALLEQAKARNDTAEVAFCYRLQGYYILEVSDDREQAFAIYQKAYQLYEKLNDEYNMAQILNAMGWASWISPDTAIDFYLRSLTILERLGNPFFIIYGTVNLVNEYAYGKGDYITAKRYLERVLDLAHKIGATHNMIYCQVTLGWIAILSGDVVEAKAYVQAVMDYQDLFGDYAQWHPYVHMAFVKSIDDEDYEAALRYAQQAYDGVTSADGIAVASVGMSIPLIGLKRYEEAIPYTRRWLKYAAGLRRIVGLDAFALILGKLGYLERAVALFGFCEHVAPMQRWKEKWSVTHDVLWQAKTELGEEAYNTAYESGKALNLETVVQELLAEFGKDA